MDLLKNIHFSYDDMPLFNGLNLSCEWGTITTIMGRSGCGKSSLLNIINSILTPDMGTVHTDNLVVATIFQDNRLVMWKTIGDNIALGAKAYGRKLTKGDIGDTDKIVCPSTGISHTVTDDDIDNALLAVGLPPELKNAYPKMLSGGMAKRVGTARALLCKPDILLIDESFNGLDLALKKDLMIRIANYIKTHNKIGICITHSPFEAVRISDTVYEMRGLPATIKPVLDISTPFEQRSEQMVLTQQKQMETNIRAENRPAFEKYGFVSDNKSDCMQGFIDIMHNWKICHIPDNETAFTPPAERPDLVIISGKHPCFEQVVGNYHPTITRILATTPPSAKLTEEFGFVQQSATVEDLRKWWGWDCLYDDLIAPIKKEKVTSVTIGHNWILTICKKDKDAGAGLCRAPDRGTEGGRTIPKAGELHKCNLRELAERLYSDDDLDRSVGVSAINAHYNRNIAGDTRPESWGFRPFRELHGDKASIGYFPASLNILPDLKVIEREPKPGQYSAEQADDLLPEMSYVIMTAQTLMNGSLPRLLFLSQNADVMLMGPTLPLTDIWKKYGVRWVCAVHVTDNQAMYEFISQGGQMLLLDHQSEKMTFEL